MITSDIPPTPTAKPIDAPPRSDAPTSAQLKGDIDSGQTRDKNPVYDPGLAPLGTDDEAAGTPPSASHVALARSHERFERTISAHGKHDGFPLGFLGFIAGIGCVLIAGIWMARSGWVGP